MVDSSSSNQTMWKPIETAPKDNQRVLYLARFDEAGKLQELDFDGAWEYWQESYEMPHINGYDWCSASGIEEPTHWAYQDEPIPTVTSKETAHNQAELIDHMVNRFLGWSLPQDFYPDAGILFKPPTNQKGWPIGTNLLTAEQAKRMFEHCIEGYATTKPSSDKPRAWLLSGHGYAPVLREQPNPPEPLTLDEALKIGWIPLYDRPIPYSPALPKGWKLLPVVPTIEHRRYLEGKVGVDWLFGWDAMMSAAKSREPAAPVQEGPISDVTEAVTRTVIDVEKLLCEKLGKEWQSSGISIQALVDELAVQPPIPEGMDEFLADLERSRTKYPQNGHMFDGLIGELHELRRAYGGDGDVRAEAFDVAVCAYRIATEGDAGGNSLLDTPTSAPVQEPTDNISLESSIEIVLRDGPTFETIAGLCKLAVEASQKREWVGLSATDWNGFASTSDFRSGAEWAERKLRENNNG